MKLNLGLVPTLWNLKTGGRKYQLISATSNMTLYTYIIGKALSYPQFLLEGTVAPLLTRSDGVAPT